jgi:hypothetical protein
MPTKYTIFGVEISKGLEFAVGVTDLEWSDASPERLVLLNRIRGDIWGVHYEAIKPINSHDVFELEQFPSINEARESVQFWIAMLRTFGFKSSNLNLGACDIAPES